MSTCRKNILYKPENTNLPCRARTHCDDCTVQEGGGGIPANCQGGQEFNNDHDKFRDENGDFIVNLDCCNNNCEQQCPCYEDVRPRVCCENPCIDGALPLLTKCGLKYKKQLQHGITLVNPCQVIYPNPCTARRSVSVKGYNKKYSFQEQLLLLKSNAYANSVNTYDCNRFVKVNNQVRCQPRTGTCPTNNCF